MTTANEKKDMILMALVFTSKSISDCIDEPNHCVAVRLGKFAEILYGAACVRVGRSVPHDGLLHVAGAAVVEPVAVSGTYLREAASPERGGAAPAGADVVDHLQPVLDHVGVRPYLLMR